MHAGDSQPTEWVGPTSAALGGLAAAAGIGLALGGPLVLVALPVLATAALLVLLGLTLRRAERAERDRSLAARRLGGLERELRAEVEARKDAEARLAWRTRLGSLRRSTEAETLADPETGLLLESWLLVALDSRIASGRRRLTPVAVVMFEVLDGPSVDEPDPFDPARTAEVVVGTVRESDGAFRRHEGGFALILDDTDDMGALLVTERIGDALAAHAPAAVIRAGVACYPSHGLTGEAILDRAEEALDQARRWRQHRIEVAPSDR